MIRVVFCLGCCALLTWTGPALAMSDDEAGPRWEFGVGLGALSIPHYRGSDQRYEYLAPLPYVRYNGERLKVDREGGRFYFIERERFKLDLSASFSFPVDSDENRARQGMPDLDPVFEIGPRAQWSLYESDDTHFRVRAALPVRLAIASDLSHTHTVGYFAAPYLQVRYYSGWETALSVGPMWASEAYHDYYYQVEPQYATSERPAYNAHSGYSGFRLTLTSSTRFDKNWWLGVFMRYDTLSGATFADSPLVKRDDELMVGLALAWIFKTSRD